MSLFFNLKSNEKKMNGKASNLKYILIGVLFLSTLELVACVVIYFQMKTWERIWLLKRINLFTTIPKGEYDKYLFSAPDTWIPSELKSEISPLNYVKSRNTGYLSENIGEQGRYYWELLKFANDMSSTTKEAIEFRNAMFHSINDKNLLEKIKVSTGFVSTRNSHFYYFDDEIYDRNNLRIPVSFTNCKSEKILIALPGSGSSPEAILGKNNDYSNGFAKYWADRGFCVYALSVGSSPNSPISFPRLGLNMIGADLAKIEDLSSALRFKFGDKAHISIAGISYGARLAELSGVLFSNINGVVSIGGGARYDYLLSEFSHAEKNSNLTANIWIEYFLSSASQYRLILKKQKYLLISVGVADAGLWGESGQTKFFFLNDFINESKSNRKFKYSLFDGVHESNPLEEVESYIKMLQ